MLRPVHVVALVNSSFSHIATFIDSHSYDAYRFLMGSRAEEKRPVGRPRSKDCVSSDPDERSNDVGIQLAALVAESQGPTCDVATFGEIASEFVIEPRNESRLDLASHLNEDSDDVCQDEDSAGESAVAVED